MCMCVCFVQCYYISLLHVQLILIIELKSLTQIAQKLLFKIEKKCN